MSEPIQSIAQNNYILHNIDAKKLYVQEPLFTANSGDAVYVGWRPDETVLWSGTLASGATATLSENISAFDKIAFVGYSHNGSNYVANGESNVNGNSISLVGLTYLPGEVDFVECRISNTTLTCDGTIVLSPTQGNKLNGYITKVVGINRKENA